MDRHGNEGVAAWLATLDPATARVLRAAAIFGRVFWRGGVAAVADDLAPALVRARLDALKALGVVARQPSSRLARQEAWAFASPGLPDDLVATLPPGEKARAHARAARWLEDAGELGAGTIASHLLQGDAPREAAPWCAEAARAALQENDYDGALAWSEHAINLGVDPSIEGALRVLQVGVHDARGAIDEAERCALEGWRVAPKGTMDWFRAAASLSVMAMRRLRPERFHELAPALDEALRTSTGVAAAGLASAILPMLQAGQYALIDLLLDRLEEILASGEHPEPTFPARVYAARALRANYAGDPSRFYEESARAARFYDAHGEARFGLLHWNNVGFAQVSLGDGEGATATLRAVVERALARDLQRIATSAQHNLGLAHLLTGRHDDAAAVERHVIAAAEAQGDAHLAATARLYLARALLAAGDAQGARDAADLGLAALREHPAARVLGLAIRAEALRALGLFEASREAAEEGLRVFAAVGSVEEGEGLLRVAHVEALIACGDAAGARAALRAARDRLDERARAVTGEAARRSFLEGVSEHARTLALAAALDAPTGRG